MSGIRHPVTPGGRYFLVKGKLWRLSSSDIEPSEKELLVGGLMDARRAVKDAEAAGSHGDEA